MNEVQLDRMTPFLNRNGLHLSLALINDVLDLSKSKRGAGAARSRVACLP